MPPIFFLLSLCFFFLLLFVFSGVGLFSHGVVMFVPSLQIRPTWTGTPLCAYFLLARATTWHAVCAGAEVRTENRPVAGDRRPLQLPSGSQTGCKSTDLESSCLSFFLSIMSLSSDIPGQNVPLLFFFLHTKVINFQPRYHNSKAASLYCFSSWLYNHSVHFKS